MAGANRRGRDWVLGGGQLAGVFVLLVVLLGMVFTLGYLLGRNQYDAQLRAAASIVPGAPDSASDKPAKAGRGGAGAAAKAETPATPDWDFYHSAEPAKPEPIAETKALAPSRALTPGAGNSASGIDSTRSSIKPLNPSAIPRGAIVLQVAAMTRRSDAVGLAQALQQKKFPAFVLPPRAATSAYARPGRAAHAGDADRYYRVQVGPYTDAQSADLARQKLESQGFKAIARR